MKIAARIMRWISGGLFALLLVLTGLTVLLLYTQPGHDFFLRAAMTQMPRLVNGEVAVGGLRSDGLLRGFTLHDVAISDRANRPFVTADSLSIRYSISDLIRRNIVLVPVDVWSPSVVIEKLHGDSLSNVGRILIDRPRDPSDPGQRRGTADEAGESGISLVLRRTNIRDGHLAIRLPIEGSAPANRGVYERLTGRGEGEYRLLEFRRVEARVSGADLVGPEMSGQSVTFEQLSVDGYVLEDPFTVTELRGDFVREGSTLKLSLDQLTMPGSELFGDVSLSWGDGDAIRLEAEVEADVLQFSDFRWLEPRLPAGGGNLSLRVSGPLDRTAWRVSQANLAAGRSQVRGRLGLDLGAQPRFTETDLVFEPLQLSDLNGWLRELLPFEGVVTGAVSVNGALGALQLIGELSFEDPDRGIPPSIAVVEGTFEVGEQIGVSNLTATVAPFRYGTLRAFLPDLELEGEGRATGRASGELSSSLQISGELEHSIRNGPLSRLSASGTIQRSGEAINLAMAATLDALSLDALAMEVGRAFPLSGEVSGSVRAVGPASDLLLSGTLDTPAGAVEVTTQLNMLDPSLGYRIEAAAEGFQLDRMASVPQPTILTGELLIDGSGTDLESLSGEADLVIREAQVGRAQFDGLETSVRAVGGRLVVDELSLSSSLIAVTGAGDLALREDQPDGLLSLSWAADSLSALRPVLLGEEVIAADTLTQLEREILLFDGIDPDTLGAADQIAIGGSVRGEGFLRGRVQDLEGEGFTELVGAVVGEGVVARSRADLRGHWRGAEDWLAEAVVDFDSLSLREFELARGSGGVSYGSGGIGDFDVSMEGTESERYAAAGDFRRDSLGLGVTFRAFEMSDETDRWSLDNPTLVVFGESNVSTNGLRIVGRPVGAGSTLAPASIEAVGALDFEGRSEFRLDASGVAIERLANVAQLNDPPSGIVDLTMEIDGPAQNPRLRGDVLVRDFVLYQTALSQLEGSIEYGDLGLRTRITGDRNGRRLFSLVGSMPLDLSFTEIEARFPDREIDLTLAIDSLPASIALAFLDAIEDVEGSFGGQVRLRGTPKDPQPSGEIRWIDGAMSLPGLGLQPEALSVNLRVREDLRVEVEAEARAQGTAEVTGTVSLVNFADPEFDLQLSASGFQAVERRDLTAQIGGELTLTGPYGAPQMSGAVTVERGELFLEEFVRGAEVIDLSDPRFFDVVDTTLVSVRPAGAVAQNAFLQNLRVGVELSLEQEFWIRSQQQAQGMDVEIGGDLAVTFDRPARELRLAGSLEAIRGSYTQFGRLFEVQDGAVEFVGTPGIDPSLSIQAVHRLRRDAAEPLNVIANVGGTLQNPEVTLSSDAQPPIPESDLISYLLFGRPSYALASGETSVVEGAAAGLLSTTLNLGVSQLGSTLGRSLGVDYLSVSQAQQLGAFRNPTGIFADTRVEMGRYVGQNVFFAVALRPLTGLGPVRRTQLPGARLEWSFREFWSTEGFIEDRLARLSGSGFGELDNDFARVFGVSLFRDWGY